MVDIATSRLLRSRQVTHPSLWLLFRNPPYVQHNRMLRFREMELRMATRSVGATAIKTSQTDIKAKGGIL